MTEISSPISHDDCVTTKDGGSLLRILIVDDDSELGELLGEYLLNEGLSLEFALDGNTGLKQALSGHYALVILDVMLPGLNGFEVLRQLRAQSQVPVLMLTARGDDIDRIVGLEIGADDYLPKPFNPRELAMPSCGGRTMEPKTRRLIRIFLLSAMLNSTPERA